MRRRANPEDPVHIRWSRKDAIWLLELLAAAGPLDDPVWEKWRIELRARIALSRALFDRPKSDLLRLPRSVDRELDRLAVQLLRRPAFERWRTRQRNIAGERKAHGSMEERERVRAEWQRYIDELHAARPRAKIGWLRSSAENRFAVSRHTIRKYTRNPHTVT